MQKIAPKILLSSFLSAVLLVGVGCKSVEKNNSNSIIQRSPTSSVQTATSTPNGDASVKKFTIQGFAMTVPDKYSVVKVENTKAWVKTDDKEYDVKLVLEVKKEDNTFFEKNANEPGENQRIKDGELFRVYGASGVLAWDGVVLPVGIYSLVWTVESNEPVPKDLDGVWSPETKVTSEDIWNIEKTIEVVSNTPNQALKKFMYKDSGFSFNYPSSWIYSIQDEAGQLSVDFFVDPQHLKKNEPIMHFNTPVPDSDYETARVVDSKKYTFNGSKGLIEYTLLKSCVDGSLQDPCKVQERGGLAYAYWVKDKNSKKMDPSNFAAARYNLGNFIMQLNEAGAAKEEKELLATFEQILKSFSFAK
jgi:hypothetical protein